MGHGSRRALWMASISSGTKNAPTIPGKRWRREFVWPRYKHPGAGDQAMRGSVMERQPGWSKLARWKQAFVLLTVGLFPPDELWNWYLLVDREHELTGMYVRSPLPSLLENQIYSTAVTWFGVIVGLRVLRHSPQANISSVTFLWFYLALAVLTLTLGGIVFPRPPIRQDLGADFAAMRFGANLWYLVRHLAIFGTFYVLFKRAITKAARAPAAT